MDMCMHMHMHMHMHRYNMCMYVQVTMVPQTLHAWDAHVTAHAAVRTALGAPPAPPAGAAARAAKADAAAAARGAPPNEPSPYTTIEMRRFLRWVVVSSKQ